MHKVGKGLDHTGSERGIKVFCVEASPTVTLCFKTDKVSMMRTLLKSPMLSGGGTGPKVTCCDEYFLSVGGFEVCVVL